MKVLVFVHGAGQQPPDYAAEALARISALLGQTPPNVPVYYADVVGGGGDLHIAQAAAEPPEVTHFKAEFSLEIQKDMMAEPVSEQAIAAAGFSPGSIIQGLVSEVNEIAGYLFDPSTYQAIQARMLDGLDRAVALGSEVVVASHSLGSLVAFDALRASGARFSIPTFFTLGSPIAKLRRLGVRTADLGKIANGQVAEWLNWYDTSDAFSDPLGPTFPLPGFRLRDVFVEVAPFLPASHDYFRNNEVIAAIAQAVK